MMVYRPSSINIDESTEQQRKTEQEIQKRVPEITHVFSRIGSAEIATDPMPPSDCDFYIYYKPQANGERSTISQSARRTGEDHHDGNRELESGRARDGRATGRDALQRNA
jgi:Cu/Ag efflux pump CusA